ncbi:MAG: acetate--CoA ligase family protein [Candidatus Pacebacteria bacterium]|nr:acetate--CoA ligase family protein [Candidatus Paceibacterota bacterium]
MQLDTLFNPRSVAIIGADDRPASVGYALMKNILTGGEREVYPVTLDKTEILGKPVVASVKDIPGSIDLAIIATPSTIIPALLRECVEKGIKHVVVISAGFKEAGTEGVAREAELTAIAKEHGIALLGPNCLGIMNAHADWNASFAVEKPKVGGIAFISQSGALGTAMLDWANREGVGFSKFVSLGNEASLTELDFMEYMADDPDTSAVLLYVEKVTDGARFLELAKRITAHKPLVVLRAGRSARGSAAVASHTGSLAPSDKIFESAIKQAGGVPVDSVRTLFSLAKLFTLGITSPLRDLVILTNGGGPSVNTADLIDFSRSLSLVTFDDKMKTALRAVLPTMAAVGNPIDTIGDAGPSRYDGCLKMLVKQKDVDAIIAIVTPQMMTDPKGIAKVLIKYHKKKPIIPLIMGGAAVAKGVMWLQKHHMVRFDTPSDVVEALDALCVGEAGSRKQEAGSTENKNASSSSTTLTMMPMHEMQQILADYDLPLAGVFVKNKDDMASAVRKLGDGPYAMKAISPQLIHKSDLKAVALKLVDTEALMTTRDDMVMQIEKNIEGAVIDGMLVQKMASGVECIIGMKRDVTFGPVIVFGLGGIFVEVLKDASMRIAPVSKDEALAQIREIKGLPLLVGTRGTEPVNLDALASAIASLSHLALDYPEIQEIDFNPVFATAKGIQIVDARLMKTSR